MGWKGYVYGHSNGRLPDDPWNGIFTNGLAPLPFMDSIAILVKKPLPSCYFKGSIVCKERKNCMGLSDTGEEGFAKGPTHFPCHNQGRKSNTSSCPVCV